MCTRSGHPRDNSSALCKMLWEKRGCKVLDIKKFFDKKTPDLNDVGFNGYSSLQIAILRSQSSHVIKKLLQHGADPNHQDLLGRTALHMIASNKMKSHRISILKLSLLLEHGANVHIRDKRGKTPLHHLFRNRHLILLPLGDYMFVQNGASSLVHNYIGPTLFDPVLVLLDYGYYIKYLGIEIVTALVLLRRVSHIDMQDSNGKTLLHLAINKQLPKRMIKDMLEIYNPSIHILDNNGQSPVDLAIGNHKLENIFNMYALKLACVNIPLLSNREFNFEPFEFDELFEEIEAMKQYKFGRYSLHDIFSMRHNPTYLYNHEAAKGIRAVIVSKKLMYNFPNYFLLMRRTYIQSQQRLLLFDQSEKMFDFGLPVELRRMIMCYLENQDLLNLLKLKQKSQ